jgi:hypothetical protein
MGLFGNSSNDEQAENSTETKVKEIEETKTYTEHTAVATFIDGGEIEVTFDVMNKDDDKITLKDYTGLTRITVYTGKAVEFQSEAFITIPYDNLETFETIDRTKKEMSETFTKTAEVEQ